MRPRSVSTIKDRRSKEFLWVFQKHTMKIQFSFDPAVF